MKSLTFSSVYGSYELYELLCKESEIDTLKNSSAVAEIIAIQTSKKHINIFEPFSSASVDYKNFITHILKTKHNQYVGLYDCLEFMDHGKISKENKIIIGDVRYYVSDVLYDIIYIPYGSLACLLDKTDYYKDVVVALSNLREMLSKDGKIIVTSNTSPQGTVADTIDDLLDEEEDIEVELPKNCYFNSLHPTTKSRYLSYDYKGYFDHITQQVISEFSNIYVYSAGKKEFYIDLKDNKIRLNILEESEVIRLALSAGLKLAKEAFFFFEEGSNGTAISSRSRSSRDFESASYIVFDKVGVK